MAFMNLFQLSPLHVDVAFKKAPVHAPPDLVPEEGSLPSLANAVSGTRESRVDEIQ
jgi:hypothetical protein